VLIENLGEEVILKRPSRDEYVLSIEEAIQLATGADLNRAITRAKAHLADQKQARINMLRKELTELLNT
jgi:hypothetical protein